MKAIIRVSLNKTSTCYDASDFLHRAFLMAIASVRPCVFGVAKVRGFGFGVWGLGFRVYIAVHADMATRPCRQAPVNREVCS